MTIVSIAQSNPFVDGRQSERALEIRTGVERHLAEAGWVTLPEMTLKSRRRVDLIALSPKGQVIIVEIKSSIADFNADNKWPEYRDYCDQLYFATLADVPAEIFPKDAGLMIADFYGAEILRDAPQHQLPAARRKTLTLSFARASAQRLIRCCEHAGLDAGTLGEWSDN